MANIKIKEKRDSATEKLRKSGCEVRYLGFSFKGNSVEETYLIRREGKSHVASIKYGPNGSNSNITVLPQNEIVKKDVIDAFQ
jgi:hypothetical protein